MRLIGVEWRSDGLVGIGRSTGDSGPGVPNGAAWGMRGLAVGGGASERRDGSLRCMILLFGIHTIHIVGGAGII